jgi:hypothetical protein
MKYLCLIYLQEEALNAMPQTEFDARVGECLAYSEEIRKTGHYVASEALQPAHCTLCCHHARGGEIVVLRDNGAPGERHYGPGYYASSR